MDVGRLVGQNQLDQRLSDDMEEDVSSFLSRIESAKSHYAGSLTGITAPSFDSFPNMTGGQSRARGSLQALKGSNSGTDGGASEDSSVAEEIPRGAHELSYMGLNGALHPDPILDRMKVSTPNTDCTPPQSVEEPRVKLLAYSFGDELGDCMYTAICGPEKH